jgi:hypothetical protein
MSFINLGADEIGRHFNTSLATQDRLQILQSALGVSVIPDLLGAGPFKLVGPGPQKSSLTNLDAALVEFNLHWTGYH